jgi:hypothetical protein
MSLLLTAEQLLKILEKCDPDDGIVFFDCDIATRYSICFVERSATTGIVYLHRQELGSNETAAAIDGVDIDEATDILVEVVSQSEKFVETKWKEVIHQSDHEKTESYLYASLSDVEGKLVELLRSALDLDFIKAIRTGKYGSRYQSIISDINLRLQDKKANLNEDLLSVGFSETSAWSDQTKILSLKNLNSFELEMIKGYATDAKLTWYTE